MSAANKLEHGKPLRESMTLNAPWSHRYKPSLVAPHTIPAESTEKLTIMTAGASLRPLEMIFATPF